MKVGKRNKLIQFISLFTLFFFPGCSMPPAEHDVHELIVQHYESRSYRIAELKIGEIGELPLGEREYMSTKGYIVHIRSITLQPEEPGEEKRCTFPDAKIEIHRSRSGDPSWVITDIQGIPVQ
jgi:hypothetical protein